MSLAVAGLRADKRTRNKVQVRAAVGAVFALGVIACNSEAPAVTPLPPTSPTLTTIAGNSAASASAGTAGSVVAKPAPTAGTGASPTASTTTATAGSKATGVAGSSPTATAGSAGLAAVSGSGGSGTAGMLASAAGTSAGAAGAAGAEGAAGGGSADASKHPCISDGNEVLFIGDSYSNYATAHEALATLMAMLAVKDGALKSGDSYRDRAVAGTTLSAPPAAIPDQWNTDKTMKPIKVVVMDGGGNDVLISNPQCEPDGSEKNAECQQVVAGSIAALKKMWPDMQKEGVSDVMMFWYPHMPGVGILNSQGTGNTISDWTLPMLQDLAKSVSTDTFHVWVVPTVELFEGHPEYFYSGDNLHANTTGETKIAEKIWGVMKDNCIGQAASAGCCMP
jgi:hypothetical protein